MQNSTMQDILYVAILNGTMQGIYSTPEPRFSKRACQAPFFTKSRYLPNQGAYIVKYEEGSRSLFSKSKYLLNRGLLKWGSGVYKMVQCKNFDLYLQMVLLQNSTMQKGTMQGPPVLRIKLA